jgi:hypothetical protein
MAGGFPIEVVLSSGYAVFLLAVAAILEKVAKHSHRRAEQYELAGFRYHAGFDRWECPEGNHLERIESDLERRMVRYRAPAHYCNACAKKKDCTDSDDGREIEQRLDSWLQTGLSQFHRGLSLALVFLAGLLLAVEAVRYPEARAVKLLVALLLLVILSGARLVWPVHWGRARSTELR